jgi:hypothetical protein
MISGFGLGFASGSFGPSSSGFNKGIYLPSVTSISSDSDSVVLSGLVLNLNASSYSGSGNWLDQSVNGYNGTISGATYSSSDGGLFDLDGINDIISVSHNSDLSLTTLGQKTIQVWFKVDLLPTSPARMILFAKLSGAFAFDGYWGGITSGGLITYSTNGGSVSRTVNSTSTISTNTWYLFTFISQITSTSNTSKVFINETEYISSAHGTDTYSESNNLVLGYFPTPHTGLGSDAYFNGKIGSCYFYNRALTLDEISSNFNSTKLRFGL